MRRAMVSTSRATSSVWRQLDEGDDAGGLVGHEQAVG
jgi:hypothetical protein